MMRPEIDPAETRVRDLLARVLPPSADTDDVDRLARPILELLAETDAAAYQRGRAFGHQEGRAEQRTELEEWGGVPRLPRGDCPGCGASAVACSVHPGPCCRTCAHHHIKNESPHR